MADSRMLWRIPPDVESSGRVTHFKGRRLVRCQPCIDMHISVRSLSFFLNPRAKNATWENQPRRRVWKSETLVPGVVA